jgi:hypothetical protein
LGSSQPGISNPSGIQSSEFSISRLNGFESQVRIIRY